MGKWSFLYINITPYEVINIITLFLVQILLLWCIIFINLDWSVGDVRSERKGVDVNRETGTVE
jgi:hypothetical protein